MKLWYGHMIVDFMGFKRWWWNQKRSLANGHKYFVSKRTKFMVFNLNLKEYLKAESSFSTELRYQEIFIIKRILRFKEMNWVESFWFHMLIQYNVIQHQYVSFNCKWKKIDQTSCWGRQGYKKKVWYRPQRVEWINLYHKWLVITLRRIKRAVKIELDFS